MNSPIPLQPCFICSGTSFYNFTREYARCANCGHEILAESREQRFIINDELKEKKIHQIDRLDRFKRKTLIHFQNHRNYLLFDVGSASGKFLYQNKDLFKNVSGLEITPESLEFSRTALELDIVEKIDKIPDQISMATAWHSLEHFPEKKMLELLDALAKKLVIGGRLIISVPNGSSKMYRWFAHDYAFFDVPAHIHQFTPRSLKRLMERFGFEKVATIHSEPYNVFGYTQSLLNRITYTHNYLYYRLKRGSQKPSMLLDLVNGFLLPFAIMIGWILSQLDLINLDEQGVITLCYEKKNY